MNKKFSLICVFAFLCFALLRVSAQGGETELENDFGNVESEITIEDGQFQDVDTVVFPDIPVTVGGDGETLDEILDETESNGETEAGAVENTDVQTGDDSVTETSVTSANFLGASTLVGSSAVLIASVLLML